MIIIGTVLENLEHEKQGLETLLTNEYHLNRIQNLLDELDIVNNKIRKERRKTYIIWRF